jgi:hypothetical protein
MLASKPYQNISTFRMEVFSPCQQPFSALQRGIDAPQTSKRIYLPQQPLQQHLVRRQGCLHHLFLLVFSRLRSSRPSWVQVLKLGDSECWRRGLCRVSQSCRVCSLIWSRYFPLWRNLSTPFDLLIPSLAFHYEFSANSTRVEVMIR